MSDQCHGDLLHEACIGVANRARTRERLTLTAVLARLSDPSTSTVAFTAVQAHQAHAWHAFLVQLAAMVCQRAGCDIADPRCSTDDWWRERLLALAEGCAEAWCLVVEDHSKPAFMQVPIDGNGGEYKKIIATPRELDVVVTTKNHDAKTGRGLSDHWLFALVTLQTQQGYLGVGNYGIFRMNGAAGNRFAVGFADPGELGAWFRRDVLALTAKRAVTMDGGCFVEQGGLPLLWLLAWDGTSSACLSHNTLDPWCIEICRRLRFEQGPDGWFAKQAPSDAERTLIAKARKSGAQQWVIKSGFADPWMAQADAKAITPSDQGFTVDKTVEYLLDPATSVPPTQHLLAEDLGSDLHWYGRTLVRGQGKTNGWHERLVPIPANVRQHWRDKPEARGVAAERARSQLEDSAALRSKVLRPALLALITAGGRDAQQGLAGFDQAVDAAFFAYLWDHLDDEKNAASRSWRRVIIAMAKSTLAAAQKTVPDNVRRWRALADSTRRFDDGLKSNPSRSNSFAASLRENAPDHPVAPLPEPIH